MGNQHHGRLGEGEMGGSRSIRKAEQVTLKNGKVWGNSGKGSFWLPQMVSPMITGSMHLCVFPRLPHST